MGSGPPIDTDPLDDQEEPDTGTSSPVSILRVFLTVGLICGLVFGATLVAPSVVDEFDDLPEPSEDPPPAGERDPDVADPDDPAGTTYETDVETVTSEAVEDFVHAEVNDRRAEYDIDPLEWDGTIASVSRAHSADMNERDYFAHTNPDGENPYDRLDDVSNYCRSYGENLAMNWLERPVEKPNGSTTVEYQTAEGIAEGLVEQWMNSPDHRDAILEEGETQAWDRGGVGVYLSESGNVYATHNFCMEW